MSKSFIGMKAMERYCPSRRVDVLKCNECRLLCDTPCVTSGTADPPRCWATSIGLQRGRDTLLTRSFLRGPRRRGRLELTHVSSGLKGIMGIFSLRLSCRGPLSLSPSPSPSLSLSLSAFAGRRPSGGGAAEI